MLDIYSKAIWVVRAVRPVLAAIEERDRDLGRQLGRALQSIPLNIAEGSGSRAGTRRERYCNALGSAKETSSCLDVALAMGYVESLDAELLDAIDHVIAVLVKNVR